MIAIVKGLGYSNPHGTKPRDWKRPLTLAAIRIIYIMEHTSGFQDAAARTLYSYLKLKIDISGLYYEVHT
ncbi:MAG: hypothetical protein CR217_04765 [Beijerinckiaceae bacterium]|nr:MAG: hypothetical protein CR217_04765 [Beijerinckiaceae bacterium]